MARRCDRLLGMGELGARRLQELQPRRGGEEQIAHLDARAGGRAPPAAGAPLTPPSTASRQALSASRWPAGDASAGRPRRSRAAPRRESRAWRCGPRSSSGSFEVAWRSTASASSSAIHAAAVVGDRDQRAAAVVQRDLDAPRAGVDGVLDQLLDRRGRPLDHLAGGDAVDQIGRQEADRHRRISRLPSAPACVASMPCGRPTTTMLRGSGRAGGGRRGRHPPGVTPLI